MPLRFNPPAPLSIAALFEEEVNGLKREHEKLAAINAQAKELGYNFEGREDSLKILREVIARAREVLNHNNQRSEQVEPSENDFWLFIHHAATDYDIPVGVEKRTVVLEPFPKPTI